MVPVHVGHSLLRRGRACVAVAFATLTLVAFPVIPRAQDQTPANAEPDFSQDAPAHIAVIDGAANLEREGRVAPAEQNVPLLAGDRLRTEDGRVEVLFADGSVLDIDKYASVDLLSESLLQLRAGRLRLSIARVTEMLEYRVDGAGASATIHTAGEYRVSLSDPRAAQPELDLAVLHGTADLSSPKGRTLVRAGTHAFANEQTEPSLAYAFNLSAQTEFDRWAEDQRAARLGAESAQHLPSELRSYGGALDQNGDWQYQDTYGYVWYPRVAPTWSPYYDGYWSVVGSFGWTWVGGGSWCWPTHHYGRWNVGYGGRWFWSPGRYWSPGWVSWAAAPGYVSWCPLGFNGRPAVALGVSVGYGRGWNVVSANNFNGRAVGRNVATARVQNANLSTFSRSSAPQIAGARPRGEPLRSPSGRISRSTSGDVAVNRGSVGVSRGDVGVSRGDVGVGRGDVSASRGNAGMSRAGDLPRAVTRGSASNDVAPSRGNARGSSPVAPAPPASQRAVSRSWSTQPDQQLSDRPSSQRSPGDVGRSRDGSAQSRVVAPPQIYNSPSRGMSRPPANSDPPSAGSSGSRRGGPPSTRGGDGPSSMDQSRGSRAVPRGSNSVAPPSPPSAPASRPSSPSSSGSSGGRSSGGQGTSTGRSGGRGR